jgi:hypothetical protein
MIAFGLLGWRPQDFWRATPFDVALVLVSRQNYVNFRDGGERPLGREEFAELRQKLSRPH